MSRLLHTQAITADQPNTAYKQYIPILLGILIYVLLQVPSLCSAETKKKILFIDSYHAEYTWSSDITAGIKSVLNARQDIELKIFRMDTKRNMSEEFKKEAALKARGLIESWQPDVVIAADDNASKYLIVPYYMNADIPFVFCGLNWDASVYGFPADNVTGMIEVALFEKTVSALQQYAPGNRIGYLASDTASERKEYENIVRRFGTGFEARFASTFDQLKQAYLDLQRNTDMVIIQECRSVKGFNHLEMVTFVKNNTSIPTAAMQKYLMHYALFTYAKIGEEQGEHAARTALDILDGTDPKTIPIAENKKAGTYLNMKLAKILGIRFPIDLIRASHLISAEQKKLLYVNSYHAGCKWSDDIEKGLLKALNITKNTAGICDDSGSEVELKIFRMDTKIHQSEEFKTRSALSAKAIIDKWKPDIIVTSDDNAAKYLVVPYLKTSETPVVFCGLNWDADMYGFPTANITGMVEETPILETIALMKPYAKGERIGYVGGKNLSEEKELQHYENVLKISFADGELVSDFQQWQQAYLRLQDTVDMIILLSPVTIKGWQEDIAGLFIQKNTKLPTGSTGDNTIRYSLLGKVKVAEEQGWWAGNTALQILEGTPIENIPVTRNKNSKLCLNMKLAKILGIKFPIELIEKAALVEN